MAQLASASLGVARLQELCARHGGARVSLRAAQLQDYADRMTRACLARVPDGAYTFEDHLDGDGLGLEDIPLRCTLRLRGGALEVDLTECAPQVVGPLNAVRAISVSAVAYVLRCLGDEDLPSNGGAMRSVKVLTRPGSVADARYPAPVAAGNVETSQRLVDVILGAFARALPGLIPAASCGSMNNVLVGGVDPRSGAPFAYYETLAGGAGAGPLGPGEAAVHTHMTNTLNTPVEAFEHAYPMRVEAYRVRDGSGGAGLHPGGDGLERVYRFLGPAQVTLLGERRSRGPWGAQGGSPGRPGEDHHNGQRLPAKVSLHVQAGDTVSVATPGGGGWGEAP
jgi:N-methylhydantoinase B